MLLNETWYFHYMHTWFHAQLAKKSFMVSISYACFLEQLKFFLNPCIGGCCWVHFNKKRCLSLTHAPKNSKLQLQKTTYIHNWFILILKILLLWSALFKNIFFSSCQFKKNQSKFGFWIKKIKDSKLSHFLHSPKLISCEKVHLCSFLIPAPLFYEVNDPLLQVCYKP